jgi:TorA maturation chaperone TorD
MTSNASSLKGFSGYVAARSDVYALLSALLIRPPTAEVHEGVCSLQAKRGTPRILSSALQALRAAGRASSLNRIEHEFQRVFVGLTGGAIIPFASWYRERRMLGLTLVRLRGELRALGLCRGIGTCESEDHAGVVCEIMARICRIGFGVPLERQRSFFQAHVQPWLPRFFSDLQGQPEVVFYRAVGDLGDIFIEAERQYLDTTHSQEKHREKTDSEQSAQFH